jgi:hypothetical protein
VRKSSSIPRAAEQPCEIETVAVLRFKRRERDAGSSALTMPLHRDDGPIPCSAAATRDIGPLGYRSEIAYLSTAHMSTSRRIWVVPSSKTVLTSNRHPASSSILTKAELAGAR